MVLLDIRKRVQPQSAEDNSKIEVNGKMVGFDSTRRSKSPLNEGFTGNPGVPMIFANPPLILRPARQKWIILTSGRLVFPLAAVPSKAVSTPSSITV